MQSPDTSDACANCRQFDRRAFLQSASVLSLGALATAACGDGVFSGPELVPQFPTATFTYDPRTASALQQIGGRVVLQTSTGTPILVERLAGTQYRALSLVCPHRGTIVNVQSDGFVCPNHGARFAADGTWLGGQDTADLQPVGVRVNPDGTLTIGGVPQPPALALASSSATFVTTTAAADPAPQTIAIGNDGGGTLTGIRVSLTYAAGQRTGWLAIQLDQPAAPATLTLRAQRGALPAGTYTATVTVDAAGNARGPQAVNVSLVVQDPQSPSSLFLSSSIVGFTAAQGTTPFPQTVQCTNGGGGTLGGLTAAVRYDAGGNGWLTTEFDRLTAPASLTLRASTTGLGAGTYTATVTVGATGVPSQTIRVSLVVTPSGLLVNLAAWPALANVGGVAGSVGNVNGGPVAVVRTSATSFSAFSMICPHAGTTIAVINGASFRCPNHGALFDAAGRNLPNSPQRTDNLTPLTVTYTPGAATLSVS